MSRATNARGRRTIAAIEAAALQATTDLPFDRITVREICERARVSERVFFNHFATREDAFLGLETPQIDERWAERYVFDHTIGLIDGARHLILIHDLDPTVQERRAGLTVSQPALLARAHAVLAPVRDRCRRIVEDAVRDRHPDLLDHEAAAVSRVVVAAASELLGGQADATILTLRSLGPGLF